MQEFETGSGMRTDRLRNLLVTLDTRLERIGKTISRSGDSESLQGVTQELFYFRSSVRRYLGKPDALRMDDVAILERHIDELRQVAHREGLHLGGHFSPAGDIGAIVNDEIGLRNLTNGMRIGLIQLHPDDILEITPGQKLAAYQFEFQNDSLTVRNQPLIPDQAEKEIALAALDAAIDHGIYVNNDLDRTNVSPRLREAFARLQHVMSSHSNIVQVGTCAQICNRMVNAESDELSSSQLALLVGHVESVFSALAQFSDWRVFSENAVSMNIEPSSVKQLAESARSLAAEVSAISAVDPSVAAALTTVATWVEDQAKPDKRDVLSLARTLENVWSVIVREVLALGREVVSKGRGFIAGGIVTVLVATAAMSIPALRQVPGAQWIESAYSYFKANPFLHSK